MKFSKKRFPFDIRECNLAKSDVVTVALEVGKGIMVHAHGNPAKVVGLAGAAGIADIATGLGYGTIAGVQKLMDITK
jgi:hypothetical protein